MSLGGSFVSASHTELGNITEEPNQLCMIHRIKAEGKNSTWDYLTASSFGLLVRSNAATVSGVQCVFKAGNSKGTGSTKP